MCFHFVRYYCFQQIIFYEWKFVAIKNVFIPKTKNPDRDAKIQTKNREDGCSEREFAIRFDRIRRFSAETKKPAALSGRGLFVYERCLRFSYINEFADWVNIPRFKTN